MTAGILFVTISNILPCLDIYFHKLYFSINYWFLKGFAEQTRTSKIID